MPYSHITQTAFGADAIAYARGDGIGHNGAEVRNEYTAGVNMLPDEVIPFEQQMRPFWERAHFRHTIQVDRLIVSFHPSELDPEKPEDCVLGLAIGCEIAKRNAPDNQSAVFLQKDGKGGKIHLHILTNDVNMSDCKGIDSQAYAHFHFQKIVDEVCQQYFDLAKTEMQPERLNPSVRGSRMKNEQIRAANELERQQAAAEGREVDPDKIIAERYIWQDDLRQRVKDAATRATDEDSFAHQLRLSGVELVPHKAKDGTVTYLHPATKKQPAHYTYELVDTSGFPDKIPPNLKSKSHKLGTNYQPEGIAKLFGTAAPSVQAEQPDKVPPVVLEMPMPSFSTAKKPAQKPEKQPENEGIEAAEKDAAVLALIIMRQIYGWPDKLRTIGPDGEEHYDFKEWDKQRKARDTTFNQFSKWRPIRNKELKKDGLKLSPIYSTDKVTGHVSVVRPELEAQFRDFLDRRDHPEKYIAAQEHLDDQPEQAAPMGQHQEKRKQPTPVEPTPAKQQQTEQEKPSLAEQERQEVEAQQSVFFEEMQRVNAANEKRWKEQARQQDDDEKKIP